MRVAVIGGGWFGCHLARHLLRQGHTVVIYERTGIFSAASGNNQDRVHQGFHYPRSGKTRDEIKHCHDCFVRTYPTTVIRDNIYAVADKSLIDFPTYLAICRSEGLVFDVADPADYGLEGVEGAVRTVERVVDTAAVSRTFWGELGGHVLHHAVRSVVRHDDSAEVDGERYDAVLNCTNLRLADADLPIYYEAAMILNVRGPRQHPSFTVMDGNFPTLLGTTVPGHYTLSHVTHTALAKCDTYAEAQSVLDGVRWEDRAERFVAAIAEFYPAFRGLFRVVGARGAVRTKPVNGTDSRECLTRTDGRCMTVVCGKFASVFLAAERLDQWIRSFSGTPASSAAT